MGVVGDEAEAEDHHYRSKKFVTQVDIDGAAKSDADQQNSANTRSQHHDATAPNTSEQHDRALGTIGDNDNLLPPAAPSTEKRDDSQLKKIAQTKLHVALYERKIANFSQKYNLKMNQFMSKRRRNNFSQLIFAPPNIAADFSSEYVSNNMFGRNSHKLDNLKNLVNRNSSPKSKLNSVVHSFQRQEENSQEVYRSVSCKPLLEQKLSQASATDEKMRLSQVCKNLLDASQNCATSDKNVAN